MKERKKIRVQCEKKNQQKKYKKNKPKKEESTECEERKKSRKLIKKKKKISSLQDAKISELLLFICFDIPQSLQPSYNQ